MHKQSLYYNDRIAKSTRHNVTRFIYNESAKFEIRTRMNRNVREYNIKRTTKCTHTHKSVIDIIHSLRTELPSRCKVVVLAGRNVGISVKPRRLQLTEAKAMKCR